MFIDLFKRLRFGRIEDYQYVGFGSVAFVDFRMVHRALGIRDLVSIEDTKEAAEKIRFDKNKPYASIDLRFGNSATVLPRLNFKRRSLVWLDYDQPVRGGMANDLKTVASDAASGSFIAMTFTNTFPPEPEDAKKALGWLREAFPTYVTEDATIPQFAGAKYAEFVRATFGDILRNALIDANAGIADEAKHRRLEQICFIKYRDGAPMATIGWMIVAEEDLPELAACQLADLPFFSPGADAFRIEMPKVTPFEIREMEKHLPSPHEEASLSWLPEHERECFAKNYRYLPNFAPVEMV